MDNTTASCNHCKSSLNNTETDFLNVIGVIHMYTITA